MLLGGLNKATYTGHVSQSLAQSEHSVNTSFHCHCCGCYVLRKIEVDPVFISLVRTEKEKGWGAPEALNSPELSLIIPSEETCSWLLEDPQKGPGNRAEKATVET